MSSASEPIESLNALRRWIGETETLVDHVTVPAVHRLAAMLDRDDPMPRVGDPLPVGWHAILFPRVVRQSGVGADGHPKRGDFLPDVPLPRRMFAGRRTSFEADLRIGDEVTKIARIQDVVTKTGRSGAMVFVTVRAEIHSPRGLAIIEEQDIVYRGEPPPGTSPAPPQPAPGNAMWSANFTPDEVMLFRYSALTFNGHRIHYDFPYVTGTEGYPALVVNGGLVTLMLYELARANARAPLAFCSSRNLRPMFAKTPIRLGGEPDDTGRTAKLWALDATDALTVSMEARLR